MPFELAPQYSYVNVTPLSSHVLFEVPPLPLFPGGPFVVGEDGIGLTFRYMSQIYINKRTKYHNEDRVLVAFDELYWIVEEKLVFNVAITAGQGMQTR